MRGKINKNRFPGKKFQTKRASYFAMACLIFVSLLSYDIFFVSRQVHASTSFLTTGTTWTVPSDWNSSSNSIEVIGGGGGGAASFAEGGGGGGGGAYSKIVNTSLLTPSSNVTVAVGAAGFADTVTPSTGGAGSGGDTYLCRATTNCASLAGTNVIVGAQGGAAGQEPTGVCSPTCLGGFGGGGGLSSNGVGTTVFSGGGGGAGSATGAGNKGPAGGGGGGAAGLNATGNNGVGPTSTTGGGGGQGDGTFGGAGGGAGIAGSNGTEWDATHGSGGGGGGGSGTSTTGGTGGNGGSYGAGGGGGGNGTNVNGNGGAGTQGVIIITYTPSANAAPAAPTLSAPASGANGISNTAPQFQLKTTDANNDYLRYKIILYNSDCATNAQTFDQTVSQTGWSGQDAQTATAYVGSSTLASSTTATYTYSGTALALNTTYCWKAAAIDPGGSNTFGSFSATRLFTTIPNSAPAAPTLISPASGATGQLTSPTFQLRATDTNNDYLQYKIIIYNSDCATSPQTFDESVSQTGWTGQDAGTGTGYVGSSTLASSTIANFAGATLANSTTYCWQAAAKDPAGSNTFGSLSATQLFTTQAPSIPVIIHGGTTIHNGVTIH